METNEAVQLWKERNIQRCEMEFNAGGDDMGEYTFTFYGENDVEVKYNDLWDFFDDDVFNNVTFYQNSEGEYGTVYITLEDDVFNYSKTSWTDEPTTMKEPSDIELTPEELHLFKNKVQSFVFEYDSSPAYIYYKDCILSEEEAKTLENFEERVYEYAKDYEFSNYLECSNEDWWRLRLGGINDTIMTLEIEKDFYVEVENHN